MKHDEFAFFNQQLAGMLRSGIPLEGALKQLTRSLNRGQLRAEFEKLEHDLQAGVPLAEAIEKRDLPEAYIQVVKAGAESESLPGVLVLIADYYTRLHTITTRLRGIMAYPAILLACAFALSASLSFIFTMGMREFADFGVTPRSQVMANVLLWIGPICLSVLLLAAVSLFAVKRVRHWFRWHFPGFRDASLAQHASTIAVMLSSGARLDTTLGLLQSAEASTSAERDLGMWRKQLAEGRGKFPEMAAGSRIFPPLFVWLVAQGGNDLALGFQRAAEIYNERALSRTDLLLNAAMPLAVVVLGLVILAQAVGLATIATRVLFFF